MDIKNHNRSQPDYREITAYEQKLAALLFHHLHKYRYVGEEDGKNNY